MFLTVLRSTGSRIMHTTAWSRPSVAPWTAKLHVARQGPWYTKKGATEIKAALGNTGHSSSINATLTVSTKQERLEPEWFHDIPLHACNWWDPHFEDSERS